MVSADSCCHNIYNLCTLLLIYIKIVDKYYYICIISCNFFMSYLTNKTGGSLNNNPLRKMREERLMSRAELARRAGVSPLTIGRIEKGYSCRLETKRKIILALGYELSEKAKVFPGE